MHGRVESAHRPAINTKAVPADCVRRRGEHSGSIGSLLGMEVLTVLPAKRVEHTDGLQLAPCPWAKRDVLTIVRGKAFAKY